MTLYLLAKFLHIAGALAFFAALGLEFGVLRALARAQTPGEARAALDGLRLSQRIGAPGALVLIVTGIYLAWDAWGVPAWLAASIGALVAMVLMESLVTRRLFAAFERALAAHALGRESERVLGQLLSAYYARVLLLVGIVALMVLKPGALGATVTLLAAGALAALIGPRVRNAGASIEHTK